MGLGNRESKTGQRRQNRRSGSIDDAEGGGVASVEIEGPEVRVGSQGRCQHAAYPCGGRMRSEVGPAKVVVKVVGVEYEPMSDGAEAGSLADLVL
jgi:hypothetical protein